MLLLKATLFNKPFGFEARLFLQNFVFKARILVVLVSKQASACILEFLQHFCETIFLEPKLSIERIWIQSKTLWINILDKKKIFFQTFVIQNKNNERIHALLFINFHCSRKHSK